MREIKTVALIGLGAIGCSLAREICQAVGFQNFRVIAGGARRERLEREGVVINGQACRFQIVAPDTVTEPADLVLVAVKFGALPQAIQDIRNQVGTQTTIISFLNGISSEEMLAEVYGWQRV
ncbi:MAG: 2-dehydropantoate 2-reductase, partial [Butyricicoccus pullicaecorum]|nr:2-dehydropantoate 2-reductase [Butyricicoccus pullicaecorum]